MCGIAGFYGLEDKNLIRKMCSTIKHRGPDDTGYFVDKNVCLGDRRLSIIDVSGGKSVYQNENKSIFSVSNNEIYNHKEIRAALEKRGHKFVTNCDSEVIVHSYEEFGKNCAGHFRGMFAFAIWDSNKKTLFLARDRLGKKPLYYTQVGSVFLFASEIKAILEYKIKRKVDLNALSDYLTFGYIPGPRTMFEGIKKLLPGHILTVNKNGIKIEKYWDIDYKPTNFSEEYYISKLKEILAESIKIRLMSDVPLGAFLSGGLDSSSIVAIMSSVTDEVKTISAAFEEGGYYDESTHSRLVAEYFGTDHHEIILKAKDVNLLPKIIWHFDEPSSDPSSIAEYLISEKAKKYVTVTLVGEGSDELFAGYRQYKIMSKAYHYQSPVPKIIKKNVIPVLSKGFSKVIPARKPRRYLEFAADFSRTLGNPEESYKTIAEIFTEKEKQNLMKLAEKEQILKKYFTGKNFVRSMFLFELKVPLPDVLLMNVDNMTMANSVEARVPFLDQKLVEFAATVPFSLKLKGMEEKYLLKKAMVGILPKKILRRKKHPFAAPVISWLENGLKDVSEQILSRENIQKQGYFDYRYVQKVTQMRNYNRLWPLLFFEVWHGVFIDKDRINF
jgi:asparagine synthase (glutamine-hydrolysing)